jgi:nucleotide-binding universal stress UspA family protein
MFKKILLPLDLTEKHQAALAAAADLAEQNHGEVTLLHVIEVIPGLALQEERPFYDRLQRAARSHLDRCSMVLAGRKIPWQGEILLGSRAEKITGYAADQGMDLMILTTPQFDPDNPTTGLGSMSWKLGIFSPCPVLLIK